MGLWQKMPKKGQKRQNVTSRKMQLCNTLHCKALGCLVYRGLGCRFKSDLCGCPGPHTSPRLRTQLYDLNPVNTIAWVQI